MSLHNKRILVGVTGGVAAYKSAELIRRLVEGGASVRVVMTVAAQRFITPLTLQALSAHPVATDLFDPAAEAAMGHIELARWADLVLVAPASADFMARLARGLADDLLATLCLATTAPLALAPAMNQQMWRNAATRANAALLTDRGVTVLGPASGAQACGETGPGRMLEAAELARLAGGLFEHGGLDGRRVLVTAGPTREPLDPVRFIGNRSSGKMGFAVASAAAEAGARVVLVAGPVVLATPERVTRVDVETAAQMRAAVLAEAGNCDIFIAAAAVADYQPATRAPQKLKKSSQRVEILLERTPDILAEVAATPDAPFTVGFAAETERLAEYAEAKLQAKSLDLVAANLVGGDQGGFESDDNALEVFWEGGGKSLPLTSKGRIARQLIDVIVQRYHGKSAA